MDLSAAATDQTTEMDCADESPNEAANLQTPEKDQLIPSGKQYDMLSAADKIPMPIEIEIETEIVYNMYRMRRLLSLGPPNCAI
jgi:hypothetical protein